MLIRRNRTLLPASHLAAHHPGTRRWIKLAGRGVFQSGKGLAAFDEHQVRRYSSWSRRVTLAMLAHAFLAVVRANEHDRHLSPCNEIQRLFITLVIRRDFDPVHRPGWSVWQRRHPARSQTSRYRRQVAQA
ncbi:hypothetical protein HerbRD11066_22050 [Herbidospora sp. RD11066]